MQITGSEETVLIRGFLLLSSSIALLAAPVWTQEATLVVENARVIVGDGTVLERGSVVMDGDRIVSVTEDPVEAPGARRIDAADKTILPGLIDAHTHLLSRWSPAIPEKLAWIRMAVEEGTALRALRGAVRARTYLEVGFTTVRDLGGTNGGDFALRDAISEGSLPGPRMLVSGRGISPEGGQIPGLQSSYREIVTEDYRVATGQTQAVQAVRENLSRGADVIKIYSDPWDERVTFTVEEMQAMVAEAHRAGVKITAHAITDEAIVRAVEAGVDAIEHGYEASDSTLRRMAERNVALVPTDLDSVTALKFLPLVISEVSDLQAHAVELVERRRERLRRAVDVGVTIVFGSDNYLDLEEPQGVGAKRMLLGYAEAGLSPSLVLRAASVNAARLLDRSDHLGTLEVGKLADLIVVDGNPLEDLTALQRIELVVRGGEILVSR